MPNFKVADVGRTAALIKKLVEKADTNGDGAVRNFEVDSLAKNPPRAETDPNKLDLRSAIQGAQRYAQAKGSVTVDSIKKAVDEIAASVKAADKNGDGVIGDAEYKALATLAAKRFVDFGTKHAGDKVTDFTFPAQHDPVRPRFNWAGTPAEVCSSLLNAYSDPKNDNFWPAWGSPSKTAARYVLTATEAKAMVKALEPLYASRQKAVITELSGRTSASTFGCVSCDAGARAVFQAYAKSVGVQGLTFASPRAPQMPSP